MAKDIVLGTAARNGLMAGVDKLANTVTVDVASQMIFKTHDDMIAYKQKVAAEKAANQVY